MSRLLLCALFVAMIPTPALAAEYEAIAIKETLPAGAVPADVGKQLSQTGIRFSQGTRVICEFWFCQQWSGKANFTPSNSILYPLPAGELVGVVRFKAAANDFRNQEIPAGIYTLRYALQPEDGNHVGTSDTRDFLVLLPAAKDTSAKPMADMDMFKLSPQVTGGTHPAMLNLLRVEGPAEAGPKLRHLADKEWWSLKIGGKASAGDKSTPLAMELVVIGHAAE